MLAKRLIPCLDVSGGRVIKGIKFVDHVDAGDPVEQAAYYDEQMADELVFYDITASRDHRDIMIDLVRRCAEQIFIPLTVGGGLRTIEDIREILNAGADKVSLNTAPIYDRELINESSERFGAQCIVIAIDAKRVDDNAPPEELRWVLHSHGGSRPTDIDAIEYCLEAEQRGAGEFVLNSIDADGTKMGYDIELNRRVAEATSVPIVASGGAGSVDHMYDVLTEGKADAALAASIFHFRETTVLEVKKQLAARGVPIRL
jgi:cyclase